MLDWLFGTKSTSTSTPSVSKNHQTDFTFKVTLKTVVDKNSRHLISGMPTNLEFKKQFGVFQIFVEPVTTGPSAIFVIGKSNNNSCGQVVRMLGIKSFDDSNLDMSWPNNSGPTLFYRPCPIEHGELEYTVRVIGI